MFSVLSPTAYAVSPCSVLQEPWDNVADKESRQARDVDDQCQLAYKRSEDKRGYTSYETASDFNFA